MATGDKDDFLARIQGVTPPWFGEDAKTIGAIQEGIAVGLAHMYALWVYARKQTRILTATDSFLDMIAYDFFGDALKRRANQSDASFRGRIIINLFRPRATRPGMVKVLEDLTSRTPIIVEPKRPSDTGAYSAPNSGYGVAGAYGSMLLPYQAFVTAFRPLGSGIPNIAGYGVPTGAYSTPSHSTYATLDMIQDAVTDADIYEAIENVKMGGTRIWARIDS